MALGNGYVYLCDIKRITCPITYLITYGHEVCYILLCLFHLSNIFTKGRLYTLNTLGTRHSSTWDIGWKPPIQH